MIDIITNMTWTEFWQQSEREGEPIYYYIEANYDIARKVMKNKLGVDTSKNHWSIEEKNNFTLVSGFNRNLRVLETPKDENGKYKNSDPILRANYYLEENEKAPVGYKVTDREYNSQSLEEFEARKDVVILRKEDIL